MYKRTFFVVSVKVFFLVQVVKIIYSFEKITVLLFFLFLIESCIFRYSCFSWPQT